MYAGQAPLRHDALDTVFAGQAVKRRAMADLVIVISQAIRRTVEQRCQPGLAIHQRQSSQVLAIEKQQVEEEED
jgi:hypothetical protein